VIAKETIAMGNEQFVIMLLTGVAVFMPAILMTVGTTIMIIIELRKTK
jgi:hypothetical protein